MGTPRTAVAGGVLGSGPSLGLRIGWGLGSMPMSTLSLVSNVLLMRFMTDSLGIAATVAAGIFSVGKIWDAVADPVIGTLSDRVTTRFGRRLPWMVAGGVLTPLALVGLFAVPVHTPAAMAAYLAVVLVVFATAYTMFMIPYLAMPAEITTSYHGRTQLMAARVVCSSLGSVLGLGVGPWLLATWGATRSGHLRMAATLAAASLALVLTCIWSLRDVPRTAAPRAQRTPLLLQIRSALGNKSFAWLMFAKLCYFITLALVLTTFPYFTKHVLQMSDRWLGTVITGQTVIVIASQPLWVWAARRFDKRRTFVAAGALHALGCASWWLAAPGESLPAVMARVLVIGFAGGGVFLTSQAMLPDAIESDAHRTGQQRAGMFTGVYVLIEKVAATIGVAFIGAFLGAMGYVQATDAHAVVQPAQALVAVRLCVSFFPAAMLGVALLAIRGYDVDSEMLERLRRRSLATN